MPLWMQVHLNVVPLRINPSKNIVPFIRQACQFGVQFFDSSMMNLLHHFRHESALQTKLIINGDKFPDGGKLHVAHVA